jgi:hypothetical protein
MHVQTKSLKSKDKEQRLDGEKPSLTGEEAAIQMTAHLSP